MEKMSTEPHQSTSGNAMMENQVAEMQRQLNQMKAKTTLQTTDCSKPMVVGGFASLEALESATTWLERKLESLKRQQHVGTGFGFVKNEIRNEKSQGLVFVKFNTRVHRDIAVAMLRSARFHEGDTAVWAQCGCEKNDIQIDDDYSEMKVGNEVVLQVFVENGSLQCRWCDTSSAWEELQNSPEISEMQELGKRAAKTLSHMGKGAGKNNGKKGAAS